MTYQLTAGDCILRVSDNAFIPFDSDNTDYQDYMEWLAAGNQPAEADLPLEPSDGNGTAPLSP